MQEVLVDLKAPMMVPSYDVPKTCEEEVASEVVGFEFDVAEEYRADMDSYLDVVDCRAADHQVRLLDHQVLVDHLGDKYKILIMI